MNLSFITLPISLIMLLFFTMTTTCWIASKFPIRKIKKDTEPPFISVILPARNEERCIARVINDFRQQSYKEFEVIVIANNSSDGTYEKASKASFGDSRITILNNDEVKDKASALNFTLPKCSGDVIIAQDADTRFDKNFVANIAEYFTDSSIIAVQPRYSIENKNFNLLTILQQLEFLYFSIFNIGRRVIGESAVAGGISFAIRKRTLNELGGWKSCLTEDYNLVSRLIDRGYKVMLAKDVVVSFQGVTTWGELIKQRSRWVRGHLNITKDTILKPTTMFNFLFKIAPLYNAMIFLLLAFFYTYIFFLQNEVTYLSLPFWFWELSIITQVIMLVDITLTEKYYIGLIFIPAYFIYTMHWIIVMFSIRDVGWSNTRVIRY